MRFASTELARRVAVGLAALTAVAHTGIGSLDTLKPVMQTDLPVAVRGTIWAAWHMVSGLLILSAYGFWKGGTAAQHFAWLYLLGGVLFLVTGLRLEGLPGLLILPQWLLLLPTGFAALWAARRLSPA